MDVFHWPRYACYLKSSNLTFSKWSLNTGIFSDRLHNFHVTYIVQLNLLFALRTSGRNEKYPETEIFPT